MAVRYLAVSAAVVYCINIGIDCPIIAMVRFQYPKLWCAVNKWFETLECATGSSQLVLASELSEWLVQDLANSVSIKLRQSAECESLIDASRLGILKNKPRHILTFKFMSLLFWCFDSAEPHRYFIDCFVCSLLNIKLVFRYNQIVFQIHFPL